MENVTPIEDEMTTGSSGYMAGNDDIVMEEGASMVETQGIVSEEQHEPSTSNFTSDADDTNQSNVRRGPRRAAFQRAMEGISASYIPGHSRRSKRAQSAEGEAGNVTSDENQTTSENNNSESAEDKETRSSSRSKRRRSGRRPGQKRRASTGASRRGKSAKGRSKSRGTSSKRKPRKGHIRGPKRINKPGNGALGRSSTKGKHTGSSSGSVGNQATKPVVYYDDRFYYFYT